MGEEKEQKKRKDSYDLFQRDSYRANEHESSGV